MARKSAEMKAKVEARRKQEAAARAEKGRKPVEVSKIEISNDDLLGYFNENRVGDAKLYSRLHRGTVIYVKYWDRFLIWGGHHWIEDDFDMAAQRIEDVCELYLRLAESKQAEAAEETDKNERAKIEGLASAVLRRVSQLRDTPGQDKLLQMLRRIRDPLVVLPKQIDQQHYVKACLFHQLTLNII